MAEQVDVYKLIVDVEGAETIGQVEIGVKRLREELKNSKIGSKEFKDLSLAIQDAETRLWSASEVAANSGKGIVSSSGSSLPNISFSPISVNRFFVAP